MILQLRCKFWLWLWAVAEGRANRAVDESVDAQIYEHAAPILREWEEYADKLSKRGHASDQEIARLNSIAISWADATGRTVPLVGREDYTP